MREKKLEKIIKDLNKEVTALYNIIDQKDELIKLQRNYIWLLIQEKTSEDDNNEQ